MNGLTLLTAVAVSGLVQCSGYWYYKYERAQHPLEPTRADTLYNKWLKEQKERHGRI